VEIARPGSARADAGEARRRLSVLLRPSRCRSADDSTRVPGAAWSRAATIAVATTAAAIGRTPAGTIGSSGPSRRAAHISPARVGWPSDSRSPTSSDGRASTTDS
jgi:hypothetical protein